jgi:hypothetical protein
VQLEQFLQHRAEAFCVIEADSCAVGAETINVIEAEAIEATEAQLEQV